MSNVPDSHISDVGRELTAFFNSLDKRQRGNPEQVALRYAEHFSESHRLQALRAPVNAGGVYNLAVGNAGTDLASLTKRVMLISDTLLLSHFRQGAEHKCRTEYAKDTYLRCPNPADLGRWLVACEPMMRHGALAYHPDLIVKEQVDNDYLTDDADPYDTYVRSRETFTTEISQPALRPLVDAVVHGRKIVEIVAGDPLKLKLLHPILQVELPHLAGETLPLADYIDIMTQEVRAYEAFRDFLREKFFELDQAAGGDHFRRNLLRIGIELRSGLRKVQDELDRLRRRRAVAATGAVVATTPVMLVAVFWQHLATVLAALGFGGAAKLLYDAEMKNIDTRPTVSEFPCYYLWLLQDRTTGR